MLWSGEIVKPTGYAEAGRGYLCSLAAVNYDNVGVIPATPIRWDDVTAEYAALRRYQQVDLRQIDQRIRVYHNSPLAVAERVAFGLYNVAMTVWETSKLPAEAKFALNTAFDEIWVPSQFNKQVFEASKVRKPIHVIPHALIVPPKPVVERPASLKDRYVFLCIGSRNARKNPQAVLRAYLKAFHPDDPVALIYKSWSPLTWDKDGNQVRAVSAGEDVAEIAQTLGLSRVPSVIAIDRPVSRGELLRYYALADAYVSAHRGEGFGLAMLEAKAYGLLVIATNWSGPTDFLDANVDRLVNYKLTSVSGMDFQPGFSSDQQWAEIDEDDLIGHMKSAFASKLTGRAGDVWDRYAPERIGRIMVDALDAAARTADEKKIVIGRPQKRLPVTMISTFNQRCGIGIYSELLARALRWRDYPLTCHREVNVPARTNAQNLGFKMQDGWKRGQSESVLSLLDTQPRGILHMQHEFGFWRDGTTLTPILAGARERGWRTVVTLHTILPAGLAEGSLFKAALQADAVIALGQPGYEALQGWAKLLSGPARLLHLPQGCSDPILLAKQEARALLQGVAAEMVAIVPGFLSPSKRPIEIIEAAGQCAEIFRAHKAKLLIAGCVRDPDMPANRGYVERVRLAVAEENLEDVVVIAPEFVRDEDIHVLFSVADFAVLNHAPGPLSNSALLRQLQTYGVPVCAASVPSLSDATQGALRHANVNELAENMKRLLQEPELRARLSEEQRGIAATMPWEEVAGRHEELYMELSR